MSNEPAAKRRLRRTVDEHRAQPDPISMMITETSIATAIAVRAFDDAMLLLSSSGRTVDEAQKAAIFVALLQAHVWPPQPTIPIVRVERGSPMAKRVLIDQGQPGVLAPVSRVASIDATTFTSDVRQLGDKESDRYRRITLDNGESGWVEVSVLEHHFGRMS